MACGGRRAHAREERGRLFIAKHAQRGEVTSRLSIPTSNAGSAASPRRACVAGAGDAAARAYTMRDARLLRPRRLLGARAAADVGLGHAQTLMASRRWRTAAARRRRVASRACVTSRRERSRPGPCVVPLFVCSKLKKCVQTSKSIDRKVVDELIL
jgi:hypothetical protein